MLNFHLHHKLRNLQNKRAESSFFTVFENEDTTPMFYYKEILIFMTVPLSIKPKYSTAVLLPKYPRIEWEELKGMRDVNSQYYFLCLRKLI